MDTFAIQKGTIVHFLQALFTHLFTTVTGTKALVVVDELVQLNHMVTTQWVDQETHPGRQVEMLWDGMNRNFSQDLSVQFSEDEISESLRSRDDLSKLQDCHNKLFQIAEFYHEDFEKEEKGKNQLT